MNANIVAEPSVYHQLVPLGTLRNKNPRRNPDPDVRSSIHATALVPPLPAAWPRLTSSPISPGGFGLGRSPGGSGGMGGLGRSATFLFSGLENLGLEGIY